jgi:hypothetical protein
MVAVEREIIAAFADRPDHVGDDAARRYGRLAAPADVVMRLVQRRADQVVHRGIDDDEILGVAMLHIDHAVTRMPALPTIIRPGSNISVQPRLWVTRLTIAA